MLSKSKVLALAILAGGVVPAWALTVKVNGQVVADVSVSEIKLGANSIDLIIPGTVTLVSSDAPPDNGGETGGGETGGGETGGGETGGGETGGGETGGGETGGGDPGCGDGTSAICDYGMGNITNTVAEERLPFLRSTTTASSFVIPTNTTVPVVFFTFAPQGSVIDNHRAWISTEPNGEALDQEGKRCDVTSDFARTFGLVLALEGRGFDDPKKRCVITAGETYYLNQRLVNGASSEIVARSIGGNF